MDTNCFISKPLFCSIIHPILSTIPHPTIHTNNDPYLYDYTPPLQLIVLRETRRGWRAWRLVDTQITRKLCNARATRILGLRIIAEKLDRTVCRVLEKKYMRWVNYTKRESVRIKREVQTAATIQIQKHIRAYLARKRVRMMKEQIKYVIIISVIVCLFVIESAFMVGLWKEGESHMLIQCTRKHHNSNPN